MKTYYRPRPKAIPRRWNWLTFHWDIRCLTNACYAKNSPVTGSQICGLKSRNISRKNTIDKPNRMNDNANVRSRCRNRALDCKNTSEVSLSRSGRCPIRAIGLHLKSFSTLSGFFFAVIRLTASGFTKPDCSLRTAHRRSIAGVINLHSGSIPRATKRGNASPTNRYCVLFSGNDVTNRADEMRGHNLLGTWLVRLRALHSVSNARGHKTPHCGEEGKTQFLSNEDWLFLFSLFLSAPSVKGVGGFFLSFLFYIRFIH